MGFTNRGMVAKSLIVLNKTAMPSILVECCFVDNQNDYSKYNPDKIATGIVLGLTGKTVSNNVQLEAHDGWYKENGNWKYGNYKSKWLLYKNVWYYFGDDGIMYTGAWLKYKNLWYYFGNNGIMYKDQWLKYKSKWYYFNSEGVMLSNNIYAFNCNGELIE